IAGALQAVDVARSAQLTTARGLVSAQESYRVRRALFQNAHATSVELTDAETELTRAWLDRVSAHIDARIADVALRHAVGSDHDSGARSAAGPGISSAAERKAGRLRGALGFTTGMNASTEAEKKRQAKDLSETLRAHREEILARWASLCRQSGRARTLND